MRPLFPGLVAGALVLAALGATPALGGEEGSSGPTLEDQIAAGKKEAWVLRRRSISFRGQTWIDGVIVVPAGSGLKLKVIRRADGDQRVFLGREGRAGEPIASLKKELPDFRREHLVPHSLPMAGSGAAAFFYAPHGAFAAIAPREGGVLIELQLPWEKGWTRRAVSPEVRGGGSSK